MCPLNVGDDRIKFINNQEKNAKEQKKFYSTGIAEI